MDSATGDEVLTEGRLEDLERFRDVEFRTWQSDIEKRFAEAFPGGDHIGHCRYHQLMIEDIEERRRLRRAILEKTLTSLIWGTILGVGAALWFAAAQYIAKIKGGGG